MLDSSNHELPYSEIFLYYIDSILAFNFPLSNIEWLFNLFGPSNFAYYYQSFGYYQIYLNYLSSFKFYFSFSSIPLKNYETAFSNLNFQNLHALANIHPFVYYFYLNSTFILKAYFKFHFFVINCLLQAKFAKKSYFFAIHRFQLFLFFTNFYLKINFYFVFAINLYKAV